MNFKDFSSGCIRKRGNDCEVLLNDNQGSPVCCYINCPYYDRLRDEIRHDKLREDDEIELEKYCDERGIFDE